MWRHKLFLNIIYLFIILQCVNTAEDHPAWNWTCEDGKCSKTKYDPQGSEPALSLEACKLFCNEYGLLWPRPTGNTDLGRFLSKININNIEIQIEKRGRSDDLMNAAGKRFKQLVNKAVPKGVTPKTTGKSVYVYLVNKNPDVTDFSLDFDESYALRVSPESNERINATIFGNTFFGIRHGMETLSQLIVFDDIRNHLLMARDVTIDDKPVYPYRGILLDTARNYYSVESIKATIEAMATVKLNTFHWHITDSQSFPMVSSRRPELTKYGAYSPSKVYSAAALREVVRFGRERGVRVLPEFDAPAHVGEGWQDSGLTVCFKAEPWASYCVEPPCGQLNPTKEELYNYLEDIYRDMAEVFETDLFHMGGDEVSERCWNSSQQIQDFMLENRWGLDRASYLKLWNYFQTKAQDRAYRAFGKRLPLILWTSTLTEFSHVENFLNKDDYIIQVWTTGVDPQIKGLLEKGYRLIMSNYDALYFDCGYGAWVGSGNNWCSPYIGWQKVYENSPMQMAQEYSNQVLGGEAALWSEQADSATLDARLWPRAAALAERLWAEPDTTWHHAEARMLHLRERLVRLGIQAESLEPEWCYQNEGYCYA
ncbi:chitooligosaccharidolytic beta-N-acetylglucosaminidase [Vanessa cardui]|uniref:chitooligosaccharidolytic beta-N-acetylglucosaminidase n=1 Tax=Vanessa cardui TaxID=171605 RepID=UPI001F13F605|nr:chitooligosaccharidolytic beta-N-acetylglucosaminidase [Vanessa cardui]XP_046962355.1 chitooligosaccharidolytic beta-N-acetylglucosaminidase [Vanessa cardui]XP_046962356.1 chitooligosaccharidolytic beta-N-acetylglucosaminidase [Vanessa cardui]